MSVLDSDSTTLATIIEDRSFDEAQVAAAAFLARYNGRTLDAYRYDLRTFFQWAADAGLAVLEAKRPHIELYRTAMEHKGLAPSTIDRRLSTICGFYRFAHIDGRVNANPAQYVRRPKVHPSEGRGLDRREFGTFLFTAERFDRDHAALAVLLGLNGLRVSEACGTNIEDLAFTQGHRTLRIMGKGSKPAVIPLVPRAARTIDLAIGERTDGAILRRKDGARLDRRTAHRWVRSIGKQAGLNAVYPHMLRSAGNVSRAVGFYLDHGRVICERTRTEALDTLVDQWATDTLSGKDAAMFAWRRANVAELNRLARERMAAEGRLSGPELVAPGGASYAAGDRIITLAPAAGGQVVTSERGVVTAVDLEHVRIAVEMEDGRRYWFDQEEIGRSQLTHGYATTVHRSQGATHDIAHVFENGGGRELAYVAMSRARENTQLYLAADDLAQAREDLCRSWQTERRWKWAIDTGSVGSDTPGTPAERIASLRQQALQAERDALAPAIPQTLTAQLRQAESDLRAATRDLDWLQKERGLRSDGELGQAAAELLSARQDAFQHERMAANKDYSRAIRRIGRRAAPADIERIQVAEDRLEKLFRPEEQKLTEALDRATQKVGEISTEVSDRERWMDDHPTATGKLAGLTAKLQEVKHENDHERWTVEGELNHRPEPVPVAAFSWERDDSRSIANDRDYGFGM